MANANVQQGLVTDFGAGENTTTDTVSSVATANAYARITNFLSHSAGITIGTNLSKNNDDLGCTCLLTDSTTVSLERDSSGDDEDVSVAYEVVEYPPTGENAVIVRMHQIIVLGSGTFTSDTAVSDVSVIGDCVPIICGIRSGVTSSAMDRAMVTVELVDVSGAQIRVTRGDNSTDVTIAVAVLEFTGSAWSVQQNIPHTQSVGGNVETEACSAVVWAETMIFTSSESSDPAAENCMIGVWPGATTTTVKFTSTDTVGNNIVHLVSNANMAVEHIDSFDGSESAIDYGTTDPAVVDKTVTSSVLADHSLIATGMNLTSSGAIGKMVVNYYFTSTTNIRFWVNRGDSIDFNWAAQLIDVSGLLESGTVVVTDVDGDESWNDGDTGLVITGTGFV